MRIVVLEDYAAISEAAARTAVEQLRAKPDSTLGLPTGNTPIGFYDRLTASGADFSRAATFNLDEYVGIEQSNPESFHTFMTKHLWSKVNLPADRRHIPNGSAGDLDAECARYERLLAEAGGIDLMFLGLGTNGHIAFNEPGTPWNTRTHVGALAPDTIRANVAGFGSEENVPRTAITMGIQNIMEARRVVVLVSGKSKAQVLRAILEGPLTTDLPATALRDHSDVTFLVDRQAAALLQQAAG